MSNALPPGMRRRLEHRDRKWIEGLAVRRKVLVHDVEEEVFTHVLSTLIDINAPEQMFKSPGDALYLLLTGTFDGAANVRYQVLLDGNVVGNAALSGTTAQYTVRFSLYSFSSSGLRIEGITETNGPSNTVEYYTQALPSGVSNIQVTAITNAAPEKGIVRLRRMEYEPIRAL